jgi:hypothetical protein
MEPFLVQVCTLRVCGTFVLISPPSDAIYRIWMRRKLVKLEMDTKMGGKSRVRAQYKFGFQTQRGNDWSIQAHGYQQVGGIKGEK